jgi:asparagine synthetase B (glutamine-hydrolysing)
MCGIAGLFNKTPHTFDTQTLRLMSETIKHRGPDDQGFVVFTGETVNRCYDMRTNQESINLHQLTSLPTSQALGPSAHVL